MQQEQKEATRRGLLEAAHAVFSELSYAAATIDDIVRRAGVSRTSFYRHFDSKWAVAKALFAQLMPTVHALWDEIGSSSEPDERHIADVLGRMLGVLMEHRPLIAIMREADIIEADSASIVRATHDDIIRRLGVRIPAFRNALAGTSAAEEMRIRAHLLFLQFDELVYTLAVRQWPLDHRIAVRVMAQQFRHFIESGASTRDRGR